MSPGAIPTAVPDELTRAALSSKLEKVSSTEVLPTKSTTTPALAELDASKLTFTRNPSPGTVISQDDPIVFKSPPCTDHMLVADWTAESGWEAPEIKPYGPFTLMPTASVFHYATECFEGLKAYRGYDGKVRLFRIDRNCNRMLNSSVRVSLPAFPPAELAKLIKALVAVDSKRWLPNKGSILYIRPTMIGTQASLGVQVPRAARLFIVMCLFPDLSAAHTPAPAAAPSTEGQTFPAPPTSNGHRAGLKLYASAEDSIRAWPGGFGYAKLGANYGPSLLASGEAKKRGYDQILWLFGNDGQVTEAGASNFFVVWRNKQGGLELITAPLDDKIILDGVTRRSVLELARARLSTEGLASLNGSAKGLESVQAVERKYTMSEIVEAFEEGRLVEAFVAGTAVSLDSLPGYLRGHYLSGLEFSLTVTSTSLRQSTRFIIVAQMSLSRLVTKLAPAVATPS
jgi:branched-chain amino acid aminotransferase